MLIHPPLVPNEALPSYWDRLRLLNVPIDGAGPSILRARAHWAAAHWRLPSNLVDFARDFGAPLLRSDPGYWLREHTLAPYYVSSMAPPRRERFVERLLHLWTGPRRPLLPIAIHEWLDSPPLICPACEENFQACRGHSAVLRQWLVPFASRCLVHREELRVAVSWSPTGPSKLEPQRLLEGRKATSLELHEVTKSLLTGEVDQVENLGALLQSRGVVTAGGRIRRQQLVSLVAAYSHGRFEHPELDGLLNSDSRVAVILASLWNRRATLHPTVAAVLINALREMDECPQTSLAMAPPKNISSELAPLVANGLSATAAARALGVSVSTVLKRADEVGLVVSRRPKILTPELTDRAQAALARGDQFLQITAQLGLSISTLYRILATKPAVKIAREAATKGAELNARKARWLQLIADNPALGVKALRAMAAADYAYLHRHDRTWIAEVSPRAGRTTLQSRSRSRAPEGAEEALRGQLERLAAVPMDAHSPRRSATGLMRQAGRSYQVTPAHHEQRVQALLDASIESTETFVNRRLAAAVRTLHAQLKQAPDWEVVRAAGLRPSVVAQSGVSIDDVVAKVVAEELERLNDEA